MKSTTLQAMDEALTQWADVMLEVIAIVDRLADEVKALNKRIQVLENER